ncbi:MAG: LysR family transcriptional regulator [Jatrophihabitans sp.]|uniref:LysR family transcriptional regulator n=1 Tax=Jatrophihabitans sp. TaxID=1932789 RepID=UPI003916A694
MLDVRRLMVLCEVARRGSLSGAAEALSYTASAISQQIAALEREAGVTLLERRSRGVVLTEAGVLLVSHAELVLAQLAAAEAALRDLSELRRGQLRMASFATAGATIVPRAVDEFQLRHPDVDVRVEQATTSQGIARLREGRLDLVLTVDLAPAPDVEIDELFIDPFRLALHREHRLARRAELRLADLGDERWINVPPDAWGGDVLGDAFARLGRNVTVAYESDDYTAIHELVGAGLGVALLPDLALFPANEDVVLRPLGPDAPSRRIQAVTRRDGLRSPAAAAMLDILRSIEPRRRATRPDPAQPEVTAAPRR